MKWIFTLSADESFTQTINMTTIFNCADCRKAIKENSREHDDCWTNMEKDDDLWYCGDCKDAHMDEEEEEEDKEEKTEKPKPTCDDCGGAIRDTENLDTCWTNDGKIFWCEYCREEHVEEYIRERDGDEEEVSECVKIREDGLGCCCAVCWKGLNEWDGKCYWMGVGEQKPANHPYP